MFTPLSLIIAASFAVGEGLTACPFCGGKTAELLMGAATLMGVVVARIGTPEVERAESSSKSCSISVSDGPPPFV
jgi:hypothetical protein